MKEYISLEKFSKRLSEAMEENNDNTYSLAEYLHLQAPTISRYKNGLMEPKMPTIESIANKYNLNIAWLLGADVSKYNENKLDHKEIPLYDNPFTKNIIKYEYVNVNDSANYCLIMNDDSMIGSRIYNGDTLYVDTKINVDNGDIIVVSTDNKEYQIKRFYKNTNSITLHSENPTIPDAIYSGKDKKAVFVIGKVLYAKFEVR